MNIDVNKLQSQLVSLQSLLVEMDKKQAELKLQIDVFNAMRTSGALPRMLKLIDIYASAGRLSKSNLETLLGIWKQLPKGSPRLHYATILYGKLRSLNLDYQFGSFYCFRKDFLELV